MVTVNKHVVAYHCNPGTKESKARGLFWFETSLGHIARYCQRNYTYTINIMTLTE
jgi:hypothetical protein